MTYSCWQRLGSDPKILGKTIDGATIVGVTPKEFIGSMWGVDADLLTSIPQDNQFLANRKARVNLLLARLKTGVSRRQAQAEMNTLATPQLTKAYPEDDKDLIPILKRATMLPPDAMPDVELSQRS